MKKETILVPFAGTTKREVVLDKEGQNVQILGYFVGRGNDEYSTDLKIIHRAPRTTANTLVKGILTDQAVCRFTGMIKIEKDAQLTNSYLADHTLLLSADARAESVPSLEIEADDVRASHEATIGRIDESQLYYLSTRGLNGAAARNLIIEGFFRPIIQKIDDKVERKRFLAEIKNV